MESCCQQHIALQAGTTAHWGSRLADQFWKGPVGVTGPHWGGVKAHTFHLRRGEEGGGGRGYLGPGPYQNPHGPQGCDLTLYIFDLPLENPAEVLFRILTVISQAMDCSMTLHAKLSLTAINQQQHCT